MADGTPDPRTLAELLIRSSADALASIDQDLRCTLWNPAMEALTGKRAGEVIGKRLPDVFPRMGENGTAAAIARALAGESVVEHGVPRVLPDGTRRYYDRLYKPLRDDGGAVLGAVATLRDATARHDVEDALRASEEQVRMAVESAGVGLWSWNMQTDEVRWADALCAIFGLPSGAHPTGRAGYVALIHPDDRARSTERIRRGVAAGRWEDEYRIVRSDDGAVRWVMSKGTVVHDVALGAVIDITERRQRDDQLLQSQKLEAVGQLTAGIAHNFNNVLMGILANLDIAVRRAPPELEPMLHDAEQSAQRAAHIIRELMTYAGRNRPKARSVEPISALVERTVAFCRTTFDKRVSLEASYDSAASARVDPAQIEQVLLNLLINARDAVTDAGVEAPRVTIQVDAVAEGSPELGGRGGEHVRVRIGDNGVGIDAATASRIFEPFFTTKPSGKGTGLGLATTRTIVTEHGGFVTCDSEARKGASFSLYLPRESVAVLAPPLATESRPRTVRGTETILFVDDEAPMRRLVARMLTGAGFDVKLVASGEEALALLGDPREVPRVALVLLDVSMPGMSGPELRRRIRELAPDARVVYLTGYAFEATDPEDAVIEKPASETRLLGTIREILDARPAVRARAAT